MPEGRPRGDPMEDDIRRHMRVSSDKYFMRSSEASVEWYVVPFNKKNFFWHKFWYNRSKMME